MSFGRFNSNDSKGNRPRLKLPRTSLETTLEILAVAGLTLGLYNLIASYSALPASIPVHFDFKGEVDSWGGKKTIWLLGGLLVVIYVSLTLVSRIPHLYNYPWEITEENAERQYRISRTFITLLKAEIVWLFAGMISEIVRVALGKANQMQPTNLYFYLALIAVSVIGYFWLSYRAR
jgi:uncharacterized membrane protein